MISRVVNPLPLIVRDFVALPAPATSMTPPTRATVVCRTVTLHADFARLTDDLERELRVALDGAIVGVVAGRIPR